jgi:hypothetical protein
VVQVYAMIPGTGKSSLLRNLTNHIFERNLYKNGVLYFNLHKVTRAQEAFEQVLQYLVGTLKQMRKKAFRGMAIREGLQK